MRLSTLASRLGVRSHGSVDPELSRLAPPLLAGPADLTLALDAETLGRLPSGIGAVVVPDGLVKTCPFPAISHPHPKTLFARAGHYLAAMGHDTAHAPLPAAMGAGVHIGEGCRFGPGVVVGDRVRVGDFAVIGAGTVLGSDACIGNRTCIGPLCSLGHAPFDFVEDGGLWLHTPVRAGVMVGDDCFIGARCTIPAGCARPTEIGRGAILDDGVHIGHDARIGERCAIAGGVLVGGYVTLGPGCKIAGGAAIAEGVSLAAGVFITAMSGVSSNVPRPGTRLASGWPAMPALQWWRLVSRVRRSVDDETNQ